MKDEQKVWVRGVDGRGSEVIKALTDLGGENKYLYDGEGSNRLYFIQHEGVIEWIHSDDEMAKIIMDNYRQLHLPDQWKDGDVLANVEFDDCFAVCKCKSLCNTSYNAYHCYMYADFGCGEIDADGCNILHSAYRLATPSEVDRFHELLHKHGKEWDAEKKKLVEWRWKPDYHEFYYKIREDGSMSRRFWNNDKADNAFFYFGNCFRTREEAEAMAEKIKKLLKGCDK